MLDPATQMVLAHNESPQPLAGVICQDEVAVNLQASSHEVSSPTRHPISHPAVMSQLSGKLRSLHVRSAGPVDDVVLATDLELELNLSLIVSNQWAYCRNPCFSQNCHRAHQYRCHELRRSKNMRRQLVSTLSVVVDAFFRDARSLCS